MVMYKVFCVLYILKNAFTTCLIFMVYVFGCDKDHILYCCHSVQLCHYQFVRRTNTVFRFSACFQPNEGLFLEIIVCQ